MFVFLSLCYFCNIIVTLFRVIYFVVYFLHVHFISVTEIDNKSGANANDQKSFELQQKIEYTSYSINQFCKTSEAAKYQLPCRLGIHYGGQTLTVPG